MSVIERAAAWLIACAIPTWECEQCGHDITVGNHEQEAAGTVYINTCPKCGGMMFYEPISDRRPTNR